MTPTDAEIRSLAVIVGGMYQDEETAIWEAADSCLLKLVRAAIAKWGTPPVVATKISIPTETMEQEFQHHYRLGYEAGKKAATPPAGEPVGWFEYARKKPTLRKLVFSPSTRQELQVKGWVSEAVFTAPPVRELPASYTGSVLTSGDHCHSVTVGFESREDAVAWHEAVTDAWDAAHGIKGGSDAKL